MLKKNKNQRKIQKNTPNDYTEISVFFITNFFCIMGEDNKPLLHDPAPYQPQQGGYPPAPQQGGYPPAPQQGGYPPQQGGYGTYQQGGGAPGVPTIFPEK